MTEYQKQLNDKITHLQTLLSPFSPPALSVFSSPATGYRMRAEFKIWHQEEKMFYAMTADNGELIFLDHFPPACAAINQLMPLLLNALKENTLLRHKLFQVEFHATLQGEMMISLIYHKSLTAAWREEAEKLAQKLNVFCIGRARKEKQVIGRDFVCETLNIAGKHYHYRQYESSFSQPNAIVCQEMITWAKNHCPTPAADLLELYCGNGNFTLPLAEKFQRVLATEISKSGIRALRENITTNQINNIAVARLSAAEFSTALRGERAFRRLQQENINLADYQFSTVLVDPPRAGIDEQTLTLLQQFPQIIYISCNPQTLAANLATLCQSHRLTAAALFDQFPHTPHIESGVILSAK